MATLEKEMFSKTNLSKKYKISTKETFARLLHLNLIEKRNDLWYLTDEGVNQGREH